MTRKAYVIGTCDTKSAELRYACGLLRAAGVEAVLVDIGTRGDTGEADIRAADVAANHPDGQDAVFVNDRGQAVAAMGEALRRFITTRSDLGGVLGMGGSGGTAMIAPAMRELDVGVPKILVSTVASGNVAPYVGPSDITMMPSVTDVAGINRISRQVLGNAANALAGMMSNRIPEDRGDKQAIALSMFGVTTDCVNRVKDVLAADYDCLVFHATGTGGQSMEKLADSGMVAGVLDITTTEVCDLFMGGVFSAGEERFDAIARTGVPYVGSCGALDMVNFGAPDTVPAEYSGRTFYEHNPQITLMRTTPEGNARMGRWIGEKLNRCNGPVRFLLPEGGVSLIDAPGQPFHDPEADAALFQALEETVQQTADRQLIRYPHNINDPEFSQALVEHFRAIMAAR